MSKKLKDEDKPSSHDELTGFDIKINALGQMETAYDVDRINAFLDDRVDDRKLTDRQEEE